jgi:hypothetical protein
LSLENKTRNISAQGWQTTRQEDLRRRLDDIKKALDDIKRQQRGLTPAEAQKLSDNQRLAAMGFEGRENQSAYDEARNPNAPHDKYEDYRKPRVI